MSRSRILILSLCTNEILQRIRRCLEKNLSFEVKVILEATVLSNMVKQWHPDLIFWIENKCSSDKTALFSEFDAIPVISVLCGQDSEKRTLEELPEHIDDIIISPFKDAEVLWKIKRLLGKTSRQQKQTAKENILQELGLKNLVGRAPAFMEVIKKISLMADSDATILLTGETGVGKEMCARTIHYLSERVNKPFMAVNCGAIPSNLLENELFGHRRGAFTDARNNHVGIVAEAEGGTLLLDEIESLSLEAQSTLLRLLQEKTYRPLGQTKIIKSDIRFIAASNVDIIQQVNEGKFRSDLFYRFTLTIDMPPLRQRRADIPLLADHFLRKYTKDYGQEQKFLSHSAIQELSNYDWPGNIRELENIIQEAIFLTPSSIIPPENINIPSSNQSNYFEQLSYKIAKQRAVEQFEREYITQLLIRCHGNITRAANLAEKDRRDVSRLVHKYQIDTKFLDNL